jgi:hypothetical protein
MFNTLLSNQKRFLYYFQKNLLIDPNDLFKKEDLIFNHD